MINTLIKYDDIFNNINKVIYNKTYNNAFYWKKEGDHYSMELKIPGYSKEEVSIKENKGYLYIEANNDKYGTKESVYEIPEDIKEYKVTLDKGILTINAYPDEISDRQILIN